MINMQLPPAIDFEGPINRYLTVKDMGLKRQMQRERDQSMLAMQKQQMEEDRYAFNQKKKEQQELDAIKEIYPKFLDGEGNGDRSGFLLSVSRINHDKAMKLYSVLNEMDSKKAEAQKLQYETQRQVEAAGVANQLNAMPQQQVPNTQRVNEIGDFSAPSTGYGGLSQEQLNSQQNAPYYAAYEPGIKSRLDYDIANKKLLGKTQSKEPFNELDPEYEIAKRIASENIPVSQWRPIFTSLGGNLSMDKPRVLATVYKLNPEYDFIGNEINYTGDITHSRKEGSLRQDIIGKEVYKSAATAGATERARLSPDIVGGKVDKQARGRTAGTVNMQRMAAQKALSTFDDAYDKKTGTYKNINDPIYTDLMLDYAKILAPNAQVGVEMIHEIRQGSLKGSIVGTYNAITGDTKTTAPQQVLRLFHNRIKALNTDLDKQYSNLTTGNNIPINSDESTNPLSTGASSSGKKRKVWNEKTGKFEVK